MDKAAVKVQRTFLESFLNSHLCNLLAEETVKDTLIFPQDGQASCIEALDVIFGCFYPAFVQWAEFWAMRQKPGQHYSEASPLPPPQRWLRCCNVVTMSTYEIIWTKMVTLCTDEELRSELMKPDPPTVAKLTRIVQEYECAQAGKQGLEAHTHLSPPRDLSRSSNREARPANHAVVHTSNPGASAGSSKPHAMPCVWWDRAHSPRLPDQRGEALGLREEEQGFRPQGPSSGDATRGRPGESLPGVARLGEQGESISVIYVHALPSRGPAQEQSSNNSVCIGQWCHSRFASMCGIAHNNKPIV